MSEALKVIDKPYKGILFIGDPHVATYPPGHRLDDYSRTILGKLKFCIDVARERECLPVILGDLFHVPRNNPNHLLVDLIELFRSVKPWVLVGNHDKHEARLTRDVSLYLLHAAGVIELISEDGPFASITVGRCRVLFGASPDWTPLPKAVDRTDHDVSIWISHHDLVLPGYESGRHQLREISGLDLVVNGHIHTPKPSQTCGMTKWCNPGSIVRISRSLYTRSLKPVICIWSPDSPELELVEVPHQPFDAVFPPIVEEKESPDVPADESLFIKGLENLSLRKTTEGVGLKSFLDQNLNPEDPLDRIIWELYEEVMTDGQE